MTKEDAKKIIDIIVEKDNKEDEENYELVISKQKDSVLDDYNIVFCYAWSTKNDKTNKWEHDFQDVFDNDYSEEEIMEELMKCDRYMILDATKTIFVWQEVK